MCPECEACHVTILIGSTKYLIVKGTVGSGAFRVETTEAYLCQSCFPKLGVLAQIESAFAEHKMPDRELIEKVRHISLERLNVILALKRHRGFIEGKDDAAQVIEELVKEHNENEKIKGELQEALGYAPPGGDTFIDYVKALWRDWDRLKLEIETLQASDKDPHSRSQAPEAVSPARSLPLEIRI